MVWAIQSCLSSALEEGACPGLKLLNIKRNFNRSAPIYAFSPALQAGACPQLQHLDIRDNYEAMQVGACPMLQQLVVRVTDARANGITSVNAAL